MRYPFTEPMHIHSLNGEKANATILEKIGDNQYIADYNGTRCTAIYNPYVGAFYVDDKYGVIHEQAKPKPKHRKAPCR